jgi:hypothetical protein
MIVTPSSAMDFPYRKLDRVAKISICSSVRKDLIGFIYFFNSVNSTLTRIAKTIDLRHPRADFIGWIIFYVYNMGMAELKTKVNNASVTDFINKVPEKTKRDDSLALLKIFQNVTGQKPKMWGTSIVGFGQYHYKSERSAQEGDWPLTGFSPRKQNLTLYIMLGLANYGDLLKKLGKHKTSVGCLYINKLSDVNVKVLEQLVKKSYKAAKKKYKT